MTFSSNLPLDTNQLPASLDVDPKDPNFQSILILFLRRISSAVNTKESGLFLLQEIGNFERWFGATPQQTRDGYRTTFDLVALNSGPIGVGTINIILTSITQPPLINGYLNPIHGFGGAKDTSGLSYFINDPSLYIRYNNSTNTIIIQNNTGNALTQCYWCMQYLKN